MKNCFTFTVQYLKHKGFNVPSNLNELEYNVIFKDIIENYKYYLKENLHIKFFDNWTNEVLQAQKNDIILHHKGVGVALNKNQFVTLNHLSKVIVKPIRKYHTIKRVCNG